MADLEAQPESHWEGRLTKRQAIRAASVIGKKLFGGKRWPDEDVPLEELEVASIH
jgi:hypothetical protein